jgi:uncharacterized protein (TIGR02145 family)
MKKIFLILALSCALKAYGQNYLISFAGTGASVSSVKVENLTAGTSLDLNGGDVLNLTILTTGINSIENKQSSDLKIYPNPMVGNSILQFYPLTSGNATISILDMTGKQVAYVQDYLDNSLQEYRLSGFNTGFYLINVKGNSYQYSGKLLSSDKASGTIRIEKISINQAIVKKTEEKNSKGLMATVDMSYTPGDILKFTGISGNYSTVKTDIPTADETITFNFIACTDGDNNNYPVIEIGTQTWMAADLKTTSYNDNTTLIPDPIPNVPVASDWIVLTGPGYCWYLNDIGYKDTYGALYNWYTVNTGKLCPLGWHAATDAEYQTLELHLGMSNLVVNTEGWRGTDQGTQMKNTTLWQSGGNGTNSSGFSAHPAGYRTHNDGSFYAILAVNMWWTSTEIDTDYGYYRQLYGTNSDIFRQHTSKTSGGEVRCVKDL